jgi:hypothetical protein
MGSNLLYASVDTPIPASEWAKSSDIERLSRLEQVLTTQKPLFQEILKIASTKPDGQVIVCLKEQLPPNQRGTVLLDLEEFLKEAVDPGLVVWLDALGDKNSLRNLRGIEVKA